MRVVTRLIVLLIFLLMCTTKVFSQQYNKVVYDSTFLHNSQKEKPTQYRRGVELLKGYQTYEQKYAGKNLPEEQKEKFPLGFGTNHFDKTTTGTGVWTELNPLVPMVDYLGIHFINPDTGWACGDLGTVIKSTDGGQSWTTEATNTTTLILKVNSPATAGEYNGNVVVASGYSGLILRSGDGGETWTQETSGVTGDLWGLQMINDTLGWSCGSNNSLIKTTDGGLTWQTVTTPGYTGSFWWIDFMNKNYGFIAGDGKVLRTTNGGQSWDIIQAGDAQSLYSIDIIDSLHIAAAGSSEKMVYSEDGGETWTQHNLVGLYLEIDCIKFINTDTGYVVGIDGLTKTTDRGNSWIPLTLLDIGEYEIQFLPGINIGYSAGYSLKLYKAVNNLDVWHKMVINDNFSDVSFTNEQNGFVVSQYGSLYRTTNNGVHWDTVQGLPGGGCITFMDSLTGYYGTSTSQIYKTIDGGGNWYQTNGITNIIAKIFFINHQIGWAAGGPRIFKTTDGGENWFEQYNNGFSFNSIYFVDSLYGWVTQNGVRPYKTTDGGENWVQQTNLNFYHTEDVYFANRDTGWITDDFDGFNKTTDGGLSWNLVNGLSPIKFSFFPDKNHWWAYGSHLYETTNNGIDWNDITPGQMFTKFSAYSNWLGYGVGNGGYIVKYTDTSYTPVELTSFSGNYSNDNIILRWKTATETNNMGFEIERLKDSKIEKLKDWERIGFVEGNGTATNMHSYSFIDKNITSVTYIYRLKQIDFDGSFKYSKEIEINVNIPLRFSLSQNYPNPFNPATTINYTIPEETFVTIKLYDITGREVRGLVNEKKQPGEYTIKLKGGELSSGVYFYRLTTSSGYTAVKKLIILK